ncbi:hypothetical protein [Paraburkholderia elongata]|uniref:Uncharacterized protein n=1 Tax=Paraburkholderia elongata TaxID=2675747 RepID=A0A972NIX7_9BURK|nr:hypothetical protein [Paraburkholderia elongata]NPT54216.1 hypothetical protein [Paraburkholderia elongata]
MLRFRRDFGTVFRGVHNWDVLHALNPSLPRKDMWLAQNRSRTGLRRKKAALNISPGGFGPYAHPELSLLEEKQDLWHDYCGTRPH